MLRLGMQRVSKSRVPGRFGYQKSGPGWARVLHFRTRVLAIGYHGIPHGRKGGLPKSRPKEDKNPSRGAKPRGRDFYPLEGGI